MYLLYCTWLGCIRSCTEDPNHGFFANRWLVYSQFVGLGNSLKAIVHHVLIDMMTSLSYWDRFPMVSALVCMIIHWTRPIVSHNLKLSSNHDFTNMFHCVISQPWEDIELVLKLEVALTYVWYCKLIIYSLWIGSLLMKVGNNRYSQYRHRDISWNWNRVPL